MSRRCLYCGTELIKDSTSNFCSKECWTEYKKVKSMNIDADKQATVLLKRNELAGATDQATPPVRREHLIQSDDAAEPDSAAGDQPQYSAPAASSGNNSPGSSMDMISRIEQLEQMINDHIDDFTELVEKLQKSAGALEAQPSGDGQSIAGNPQFIELEQELEKVSDYIRTLDKFNSRLTTMEKRIKTLEVRQIEPARKKGFFGRLFG